MKSVNLSLAWFLSRVTIVKTGPLPVLPVEGTSPPGPLLVVGSPQFRPSRPGFVGVSFREERSVTEIPVWVRHLTAHVPVGVGLERTCVDEVSTTTPNSF